MTFYGNPKTTNMLKRLIDREELPQSVLITGTTGVGKSTLAVSLSKYLLCKQKRDGSYCDGCTSCIRITAKEHPEVAIIEPDGDITKIWQLWSRPGHPSGALESLSYRPVLGNWRIVIICAAHTLNEEAANSLLKVLEEPPPYVQFFLCTTSQAAVLQTIASRCFTVPIPLVSTQMLVSMLQTKFNVEDADAVLIAKYADGCPGRAITLINDAELTQSRNRASEWVADFLSGGRFHVYGRAESLRSIIPKTITDTSARQSVTRGLYAVADAFRNHVDLSPDNTDALLACIDHTMQAAYAVQRNANPQMVTEALVAKMCRESHRL